MKMVPTDRGGSSKGSRLWLGTKRKKGGSKMVLEGDSTLAVGEGNEGDRKKRKRIEKRKKYNHFHLCIFELWCFVRLEPAKLHLIWPRLTSTFWYVCWI